MKPEILVKDDAPAVCDVLLDALSEHLLTVYRCHQGREALSMLSEHPEFSLLNDPESESAPLWHSSPLSSRVIMPVLKGVNRARRSRAEGVGQYTSVFLGTLAKFVRR